MSSHEHARHSHISAPLKAIYFALKILVLCIFAYLITLAVVNFDRVLRTLTLTHLDAIMIPVGSLTFLVIWRLLDRFLFSPYLSLVEAREAATSGAQSSAHEIIAKAQEAQEAYQQQITAARIAAMKEKLDQVQRAKAEAARIIEKAESQAQEHIRSVRWDISQRITELRAQAMQDADQMVDMVVQKVRTGSEASH